jgi:Arc/MetJ family transcription regulator
MGTHMKTTIDIADELLAEAKLVASQRRTTLRALVEEGLEGVLHARVQAASFRLRDASVGGNGSKIWHDLSDDQRTALMYADQA